MKTKIVILAVFSVLFVCSASASAATQVTLTGSNLGRTGTQFNKIASSEGLLTDIYNHFGSDVETASHLCALTEKYYSQLGLDKPYTVYVKKTTLGYVSCWNDHNYLWKSGSWVSKGACSSGPMLTSVTCETAAVICSSNTDCGTSAYVGSPFCQSGNVYQDYKTFTCSNPGTSSSSCSNSTAPQLKETCAANQTCSNGQCASIACSSSSDCGTNVYVGSPFCQSGNVYQNFKTFTCNNAGTVTSNCTNNTEPKLKETCNSNQTCSTGSCSAVTCSSNTDCGTNAYEGSPFCQGNAVYKNYRTWTCNNAGTATSSCSSAVNPQLQTSCSSNQTCSAGSCSNQNITCSNASDCGTNSYTGSTFCSNGDVFQNYTTWTCNNAGTANSSCSSNTTPQLKTNCSGNQTCSNGSCSDDNDNDCTSHSYQQCSGSYLYWYDSCGNKQDSQYCSNGCYYNTCNNNNNDCTSHSYQQCSGNYLYWYDSCGNKQDSQYCSNGCSGNYCNNYNNQNTTLTVNEKVRNLSSGNLNWSSTVSASPSDILMFMITVQAPSNRDIHNVVVRDIMPANFIYNNQLVVSGSSYNYSGDIISGVNLNTISAGQTVTITYQVQLTGAQNFSYGVTTINDNVSVTSSDSGYNPVNNASVSVNRSAVYGASYISTGLTNNLLVDSFFLPLMLALLGLWMFKSGLFGFDKWSDSRKIKNASYKAEKELKSRISDIKRAEGI